MLSRQAAQISGRHEANNVQMKKKLIKTVVNFCFKLPDLHPTLCGFNTPVMLRHYAFSIDVAHLECIAVRL